MLDSIRRTFRSKFPHLIAGIIATAFLVPSGTLTQAYADPPPWAPAHGYYKKRHKNKHKRKTYYEQEEVAASDPVFVSGGRCNREDIGRALGAVLGGAVGATVTEGDSRPIGFIAGAILGYVVGGGIGRSMDERDRACVGQALEYAEDHETIAWENPDRNTTYRVTPTNTYSVENGYCREYTRTSLRGGERTAERGKACREPEGRWKIIR